MSRPYLLWYSFLVLWAWTQLVFGAVRPWAATVTAAILAVLYVTAIFSLPARPSLSRWGRIFMLSTLGIFCLHFLPLGSLIAPYTHSLRASHGSGTFWPATADVFLATQAFVKIFTYVLCAIFVVHLRQSGLPSSTVIKGICWVLVAQALYAMIQVSFDFKTIPFYDKPRPWTTASGTFVNRNSFAGLMAMGLVTAIGLCLDSLQYRRHEKAKGLFWNRRVETGVLWGFAASLFALAIVLSQSRGGAIAALAAAIAVPVFSRGRSHSLGIFVLILLGTIGVIAARPVSLMDRFLQNDPNEPRSEQRLEYWKTATRAAGRQPILGFGIGTYPAAYHPFQPPEQAGQLNHPHNEYINAFFEGGIVWLALLLGGLGVWMARVWKSLRRLSSPDRIPLAIAMSAVLAVAIHSIVDFDLQIPSVGMLFAVMIALGVSRIREGLTPLSFPAVAAPGLFLAAGAAALAFLPLAPEPRMREAQRADDPAVTEALCRRTLGLSPYDYETVWIRGLAAQRRGDPATTDRHFAAATDLWPAHPRLQEETGMWFWARHTQSNDPDHFTRATRCFHRLFLRQPKSVVAVLQRIWDPRGEISDYAALIPDHPHARAEFSGFLVQQGRWQEGMEFFERGYPEGLANVPAFDVFADRLEAAGQWGMEARVRERRLTVQSDPEAYAAAARAWSRLGAHDRAIDCVSTAIRIAPVNPAWRTLMGELLTAKGDFLGAIEAYTTTLKMDPLNEAPRLCRAELYVRERMYAAAARDYRELLHSRPDDQALTIALSRALDNQGDTPSAHAVLQAWLFKHPDDQEVARLRDVIQRKIDAR